MADTISSIDPSQLSAASSGYDQSFAGYTDAAGNYYSPTYGGEMNQPVSYATTQKIGNDVVNVQYDTSGNVISATGQPVTVDGKQYVRDYSPTGDVSYREYAGPNSALRDLAPVIGMVGSAFGLPGLIGSTLAPGAAAATQAALGGAAMGGGLAAASGQNVLKGALLGGGLGYAGSALGGSNAIDTNGWDMASAANYDAGLQGVGNNLGGLSDLQLAQMYDQGLFGVGANISSLDAQTLARLYDEGLIGVGSNVGEDFALAQAYDQGLTGVGDNLTTTSDLPQADYSNEGRNYTTPGSTQGPGGSPINASVAAAGLPAGISSLLGKAALTGLLGAGAKSVIDTAKDGGGGTGGGSDGFNPVGGYTFNPAVFQASVPDPTKFRPTEGVVTVSDAIRQAAARQAAAQPVQAMAEGGQTQSNKPRYTGKAALSAMSPWERAAAQLNNAAYFARMPVGMANPQTAVAQLGQFAAGGGISDLGSYSDGGRMLKGAGDGMSDSIPATIGGKRPARLADGEFVVPADVVSGLGNGSTDAGAKQLYKMMDRVRQSRTGTKKQGREINPGKLMPV